MLNLYPNPATNMIQITYPPAGSVRIEIYDVLGHLISQQSVQDFATQFIIEIGELPSALYELRLIDAVGVTLESNLFIKQ